VDVGDDLDERLRCSSAAAELPAELRVGGQLSLGLELALERHGVRRGEPALECGPERGRGGQGHQRDRQQPDVGAAQEPPDHVGRGYGTQPAEPSP
jgi:hypothetical protein